MLNQHLIVLKKILKVVFLIVNQIFSIVQEIVHGGSKIHLAFSFEKQNKI
jgi:hypothetical protein